VIAAVVSLWASHAHARQVAVQIPGGVTGLPGRDMQPQKVGTAVLRGRIVSADAGTPLRRAQVRITSPDIREGRIISTDADGRFEIKDLPAGRYTVNVSKAGFVGLSYGQKRPNEQPKPIELADGQVLEKIDVSLPRGSVITGRIVDEFGEPVASVSVQVLRSRFMNGQRRLVNVGTADSTDDIGQFRLFGLPPGEYVVSAALRAGSMTVPGMDSADRSGYAPTYYPGTLVAGEAQRVSVGLGVEMANISFALVPTRTAKISGTVIDSQGRALANAIVMVRPDVGAMAAGGMITMPATSMVQPDGTFTLSNVAPGQYALDVRSMAGMGMDGGEFGSVNVTVSGADVAGVSIVTGKGATARGQVVFEGGTPPNVRMDSMQIMGLPTDLFTGPILAGGLMGKIRDDGTFELSGQAGPRKFQIGPRLPTGWFLKSVVVEGTDVTDSGYDFRGTDDVNGFVVTLTNRTTEFNGTVADAKGNRVTDYTAVLFATDSDKWQPNTRSIRVGRPDQQGTFKVQGLPPGEYYAVAVEYLEQGEEGDPEMLARLARGAQKVQINEGETKSISLKLSSSS
jgi:hypothetical protein